MQSSWGDPGISDEERNWLSQNPDFKGFGNVVDYMWQTPKGQQHNLSAEGGSENTAYFVSVGYQNAVAGVPNTNYDKYNFRSSVTAKLSESIELEWLSGGFIEESLRPYWQYGDGAGTEEGVDGWFQFFSYYPDYRYGVVIDNVSGTGRVAQPSDIGTPGFYWSNEDRFYTLVDKSAGYRNNSWKRFNNKLRLRWDLSSLLTEGLSISAFGNFSYNNHVYNHYNTYVELYDPPVESSSNRWKINSDISTWNHRQLATNRGIPNLTQNTDWANQYQLNWHLEYNRSFGSHKINSVALYEFASDYSSSQGGGRRNPLIDGVDQFYNYSANSEDTWFNGSESQYARASSAFRVNYNFKDKYIAEFSFRYDGSYLFPKETRWGFFPAFSAGWRIDQEEFFDISWISSLKPRISYGSSGDEGGISPFQFQNSYNKSTGWEFGDGVKPGLSPGVLPNPNITWAKSKAINIGVDFGLLNELIFGGLDLFYRKNSDILGTRNQQFPSTWGASLPAVNYGANDIRGVELFLNHNFNLNKITCNINANIAYAKDKILIKDESPEVFGTWRSEIGRPASGIIWGYRTEGIIMNQSTLDGLPEGFNQFGRFPEIGDLLIRDIRGAGYSEGADGVIDAYDRDILSENGKPRITYGFGGNVGWRNLLLNIQFSGVGAFDKMYSVSWGDGGAIDRDPIVLKYRWHPEMNPEGWAPTSRQTAYGRVEQGHGASDIWLFNAAYLRLKNIALSYVIPFNSKILNNGRVFISGTDLFTFSKWPFGDPEIR